MSPLLTEIPVRTASDLHADLPIVELWVEQGLVHHRRRAMKEPVFLIGSADDCDLVLKLPEMPKVHSYLLRSPEGVAFRQLAQVYPISLNGALRDTGVVRDGDVLELGPFRFLMAVNGPIRLHGEDQEDSLGHHVVRELVQKVRAAAKSPPMPQLQLYCGDEAQSRSA